jgi:RNA polymerase sigma-70 factor (ECF subfamily)
MKQDYFKNLFYSFYAPLCNYALKITGSKETAEDIVQSLFLELYEKKTLSNIEHPEKYLIRSVKYKCIDYLRRNINYKKVNFDEVDHKATETTYEISEEDIEPLLHYFAAKLPEKTRVVFLLSRKSGMTYKEIAERLDISVKTVETQMGRALRILKEILKKHNYLSILFFL